jgi:hypothetical protein
MECKQPSTLKMEAAVSSETLLFFYRLYGIAFQKTVIFTLTAVRVQISLVIGSPVQVLNEVSWLTASTQSDQCPLESYGPEINAKH